MSFTTTCFIRKNTPELRKELKRLGYEILSPLFDKGDNIIAGYSLSRNYCAFKNSDINWFISNVNPIDCGENEELFLSIAALRDDSDIKQWFVDDNLGNDWVKSEDNAQLCDLWQGEPDLDDPFRTELENEGYQPFPYHKATVEELINHFQI